MKGRSATREVVERGQVLADVMAAMLDTYDIVFGEIDR